MSDPKVLTAEEARNSSQRGDEPYLTLLGLVLDCTENRIKEAAGAGNTEVTLPPMDEAFRPALRHVCDVLVERGFEVRRTADYTVVTICGGK